jgi:hypothetical protein
LEGSWLSPANSALGVSNAAPADNPAMVKLRRDIPIDFVCSIAIFSLIMRATISYETRDVGVSEGGDYVLSLCEGAPVCNTVSIRPEVQSEIYWTMVLVDTLV